MICSALIDIFGSKLIQFIPLLFVMPLKHATETFLVVLLGAVIAVTGFAITLLPPIPTGVVPWGVLFVLSFVYPILLYPLFKRDRADYTFRLLHWFPTEMLVLWMIFQLLALFVPAAAFLTGWFTWGWTLVFVALGMLMLIRFCLTVIRRRVPRVSYLLLILGAYAIGGLASEGTGMHPEKQLAAMLWGEDAVSSVPSSEVADSRAGEEEEVEEKESWWRNLSIAQLLTGKAGSSSSEKNLEPSEDPSEEKWREQLREMTDRERKVAMRREERAQRSEEEESSSQSSEPVKEESSSSEEVIAEASSSSEEEVASGDLPESLEPGGSGAHLREVASVPSHLPDSGFGWGLIGLTLLAGYTGAVHDRTRRRKG